ncbi:hypothetical protein PGTUg99_021611 [Puccinia graminis f. sp. tritici]|uniref:Uncharacterized protein n=1 Tax=Puccinia graminis f. sp. tritici TaxID=56615 RepID=A0A5B0MTL3_PUCGR|nr:hypothetical protein PGTUg99_021611 [Puccinia graminis f. sp. tritici]
MLTSSTSTEICGSDAQGFDFSLKIILNHVWTKDEGDSTDDIDNNLIDSICLSFTPQLKTTSGVDWNLDSSLIDRLVRGRSGGHFSYLSVERRSTSSWRRFIPSQASLIACQASLIAWYEDDLVVVFLTYLVSRSCLCRLRPQLGIQIDTDLELN